MTIKRMTSILAAVAATVWLSPAFAQGTSEAPSSEMYSIDEMFEDAQGNDMLAFVGSAASAGTADGDDEQVTVVAHEGGGGEGWHHEEHHVLSGSLALTDDQFEKLHSLHESFMDSIGPMVLKKHTLKRHMKDEMMAVSIDSGKVKDLSDQLNKVNADLERAKVDHMLAVANVFTPDQRKALHLAMIKHGMHHHHGGMHHHWGGMHHGGGEHHEGPMHGPEEHRPG